MARVQKFRDRIEDFEPEYFRERIAAGWKLTTVEWEREVNTGDQVGAEVFEEVPFGLRVADDCRRLTEDNREKEVLIAIMEEIVRDSRFTFIADELNRRGFRTRQGRKWGPADVFDLLPRLIEAGPRILSSDEWAARRPELFRKIAG
jgi:hypothetical protein